LTLLIPIADQQFSTIALGSWRDALSQRDAAMGDVVFLIADYISRVLCSSARGIMRLHCESDGDKSGTRLNCKKYDLSRSEIAEERERETAPHTSVCGKYERVLEKKKKEREEEGERQRDVLLAT